MSDEVEKSGMTGESDPGAQLVETTPGQPDDPAPAETSLDELPPPPPPPVASEGVPPTRRTLDERKALLANNLQSQVASGARIESQGDFQAVVVRGHRTNHLLHFFIGLFTLGAWWIVWFFIAIFGGEKRQMLSVDEFGNTFVQKV